MLQFVASKIGATAFGIEDPAINICLKVGFLMIDLRRYRTPAILPYVALYFDRSCGMKFHTFALFEPQIRQPIEIEVGKKLTPTIRPIAGIEHRLSSEAQFLQCRAAKRDGKLCLVRKVLR